MSEAPITSILATSDLSIFTLIINADFVVKIVLLLLLLASLFCWSIIFEKFLIFRKVLNSSESFEEAFWSGQSLEILYERMKSKAHNPLSSVFIEGIKEYKKFTGKANHKTSLSLSFREIISQKLEMTKNKQIAILEKNLSFLAITGSAAPFVGLFGTVWGIMNSFQAIANLKNASIAAVAPGLAEALFATAVGLVAAIPAVIFYNLLTTKLNGISDKIEEFTIELTGLLIQEIDNESHGNSKY